MRERERPLFLELTMQELIEASGQPVQHEMQPGADSAPGTSA